MSLLKIILIITAAVTISGGGYYAYKVSQDAKVDAVATTEMEGTTPTPTPTPTPGKSVDNPLSGIGSVRALLGLGKSLVCDFTYTLTEEDANGGKVAGTFFIDKESLRGDFEIKQSGATYQSHIIQNDGKMHTWTVTPLGTVASVFSVNAEDGSSSNGKGDVLLENELNYNCKNWSVDASKFVPPSDITFKDMDALINSTPLPSVTGTGGAQGSIKLDSGDQCGLCAQIADPSSKSQCLTAFKCSQ